MQPYKAYEMLFEALKIKDFGLADFILHQELTFIPQPRQRRTYSNRRKLNLFIRDGFTDRYSGDRLVNPGFLKVISTLYPEDFPYHPHGLMTEGHIAYWRDFPTVDNIVPIARGGDNSPENLVTTSMLHNTAKFNRTLQEVGWTLYDPGNLLEWDGMSSAFLNLVEKNPNLLSDRYILTWYTITSKSSLNTNNINSEYIS